MVPIDSRRNFLLWLASGAAATACQRQNNTEASYGNEATDNVRSREAATSSDKPSSQSTAGTEVPRRRLGKTGAQVSLVGLGGYHIGKPPEPEAIKIMHRAIDEGMTFFDNCWDYHDGESERRMGRALKNGKRQQVFLMTKFDGRTEEPAAKQIDQSLKRLQTDVIDLMQIHEIIRDRDPEWVFGSDGAIEALERARKAGKIRYVGFTGHKDPKMHLDMLSTAQKHDYEFDTVQMPLNVMDAHYDSFEKQVLPELVDRDIGALGMKPLAAGAILKTDTASATECLHYAMNLPTSTVITGCESMRDLEQALEAARSFAPLSEEAVAKLLSKSRRAATRGEHEKYKTTQHFDGTARNPHWLTSATL